MDNNLHENKERDDKINIELYFKLRKEEERLDAEINEFIKQGVDTDLKPQMELLHKYNSIKDATQEILGYLADIEQSTVSDLHKLYDLPLN